MMVQSVERALEILCQFSPAERELGITELSQRLGLSKSATHALVKSLEKKGFLTQNPENSRYRLGVKVYELGMAYTASIELQYAARLVAQRLSERYNQSVHVAVYAGGMAVFVLRTEPSRGSVMFGRMGATMPAHATACGKVLLAYRPAQEIGKYIDDGLLPLTRNTITDRVRFLEEMTRVRRDGYAIDNEEATLGLACIAAPVRDYSRSVAAAISLSGSPEIILGEKRNEIIEAVKEAAREVSRTMGYLPGNAGEAESAG